jgi:hypothetical protein
MRKKIKTEDSIHRLGTLMNVMGITDFETGMPPLSEENRAVVKLQLLAAQVLVRDVLLLKDATKTVDNEASANVLVDKLAATWAENIADFAKQILSNNGLKLNVVNVLKEFGKYTSLHS